MPTFSHILRRALPLAVALHCLLSSVAFGAQSLQEALLGERWFEVLERLEPDAAGAQPPQAPGAGVRALLRGHASLALNRNDDSLECFLAASDGGSRLAWAAWCSDFAASHRAEPIALYLLGDACARLGTRVAALAVWSRALELRPDHVLSLNARGALAAQAGLAQLALADLLRARHADPGFADAHANLAAWWLQRRDGARGGRAAARRARQASSGFLLARYCELCFAVMLGDASSAPSTEFGGGALGREWLSLQLARVVARLDEAMAVAVGDDETPPGMQVDRLIGRIAGGDVDGIGGAVNQLVGVLGKHPEYREPAGRALAQIARTDPALGARIGAQVERSQQTSTGLGRIAGDLLKSASLSIGAGLKFGGAKTSKGPGFGAELGGSLDLNARALGARFGEANQGRIDASRNLLEQLGTPSRAGGFKTDPEGATIDLGDWRFAALFGLAYPRSSRLRLPFLELPR